MEPAEDTYPATFTGTDINRVMIAVEWHKGEAEHCLQSGGAKA
ncbi:MAG: hypothetical protein ACTS10_09420 [Kiloniellales bacterium]